MAHFTHEIVIQIPKPENRKITNDVSSTQCLRTPPATQQWSGITWGEFGNTSSRKEVAVKQVSEDVRSSVWWSEGKEDIPPRDTEFLVSESPEGSKVWTVTESAIVPGPAEPWDCAQLHACASSGKRIINTGYFLRTGCLFFFSLRLRGFLVALNF